MMSAAGAAAKAGSAPASTRCLTVTASLAIPTGDASPPPAVYNTVASAAEKKAGLDTVACFVLGVSAGCLIGLGACLMTMVGGASPGLAAANPGLSNFLKGAVGLPAGLGMVLLTGAELSTGNMFIMLTGVFAKKISFAEMNKNIAISYVGNFVGSLLMAYLAFGANTAAAPAAKAAVIGVATMKCALPFSVAFCKGIVCNWLVGLAIWCATSTTSVVGKLMAIFWPISLFVALGMEHSVANMFLIPHGILNGAAVTWGEFLMNNLLPVTLGNFVGGMMFMAGIHYFAYGRNQ